MCQSGNPFSSRNLLGQSLPLQFTYCMFLWNKCIAWAKNAQIFLWLHFELLSFHVGKYYQILTDENYKTIFSMTCKDREDEWRPSKAGNFHPLLHRNRIVYVIKETKTSHLVHREVSSLSRDLISVNLTRICYQFISRNLYSFSACWRKEDEPHFWFVCRSYSLTKNESVQKVRLLRTPLQLRTLW